MFRAVSEIQGKVPGEDLMAVSKGSTDARN
jgi:hypothetical protein